MSSHIEEATILVYVFSRLWYLVLLHFESTTIWQWAWYSVFVLDFQYCYIDPGVSSGEETKPLKRIYSAQIESILFSVSASFRYYLSISLCYLPHSIPFLLYCMKKKIFKGYCLNTKWKKLQLYVCFVILFSKSIYWSFVIVNLQD